jgi:glutaredoxin 3
VPQIWIGAKHIGGCDDLFALERAGKLDALLLV